MSVRNWNTNGNDAANKMEQESKECEKVSRVGSSWCYPNESFEVICKTQSNMWSMEVDSNIEKTKNVKYFKP